MTYLRLGASKVLTRLEVFKEAASELTFYQADCKLLRAQLQQYRILLEMQLITISKVEAELRSET